MFVLIGYVFESKETALKLLKEHKEARFKAFKTRAEAEEFSKNGKLAVSINMEGLKSPSSLPIPAEKSLHRSLSPQELCAFRKEIEQNNLSTVYQMIMDNPRYLVSVANTPTILKNGPRYNALHVAVLSKNLNMCKLILQTIELPAFIQLLHMPGQTEQNVMETGLILLESYLNMPDKSRRETPLHYAAQYGLKDIVELLITYNLCKMTHNKDGLLPKEVICNRCDPPASDALKKTIADLLEERFFVPVYRSHDESEPPIIGEPFTGNKTQANETGNKNGLSPERRIAALAGPMDKDQARAFQKRWKTPPRLQVTNMVRSPGHSTPFSDTSPLKVKNHSFINNNLSSTPVSASISSRRLFADDDIDEDDHNGNPPSQQSKSEPNTPTPSSTKQQPVTRNCLESMNRIFTEYREDNVDDSLIDTSLPFGYQCEETGAWYEPHKVFASPAFKERTVRTTDPYKGLERVGRDLAKQHKIGWREYWKFLDAMVDLSSSEGLALLESHLEKRENSTAAIQRLYSPANDSISAICASLNTLNLNKDATTPRSKPLDAFKHLYGSSPDRDSFKAPHSNITNPTLSIEKALRVYAKRACAHIVRNLNTISDAISFELKKLNSVVISFVGDTRFLAVDFKKTHSRYATLIKWHIANQEHPDGITSKQILNAVKKISGQKLMQNLDEEVRCIVEYLGTGATDNLLNPEMISSEADCINAWNKEKACSCLYVMPKERGNVKARRKIREFRLNLMHSYASNDAAPDNIWNARNIAATYDSDDDFKETNNSDDEQYFVSKLRLTFSDIP